MAEYLLRERKGRPLPRRVRRFARRFARDTTAGPIVEFAIIVPVLLLLLLGIIDFANAFFEKNVMISAVREGARLAVVQPMPCVTSSKDSVRERVWSYLPVKLKGQIAQASIIVTPDNCANITQILVATPNYTYVPINPAFRLINKSGVFVMNATATFRWERSP